MHAITVAKMTLDLTYKCMPYEENDVKPRMEEIQKTWDTFKGTLLRMLNFSCVRSRLTNMVRIKSFVIERAIDFITIL